jgi:hypothetical protein
MEDFERMQQATNAQQKFEWGMISMQTSFPRLRYSFRYEERFKWQIILKMMVLLFNLRAKMVGINKYKTHIWDTLLIMGW